VESSSIQDLRSDEGYEQLSIHSSTGNLMLTGRSSEPTEEHSVCVGKLTQGSDITCVGIASLNHIITSTFLEKESDIYIVFAEYVNRGGVRRNLQSADILYMKRIAINRKYSYILQITLHCLVRYKTEATVI
jgi:hypothetical protein